MPRNSDAPLDFRPDYFTQFDALLQQLRDAVPDLAIRAEILAALQLEGRDLDPDQLAGELRLDAQVVATVKQLAAFGDEGDWSRAFGSVCIAQISAGSSDGMCSVATFVLATRKGSEIAFSWQDENGAEGDLGVRDQPLSLIEAIVLVDAVLLAQAPYDVVDGDWRSGYLTDDSMVVSVSSGLYPQLGEWYRRAISEWRAAHQNKE